MPMSGEHHALIFNENNKKIHGCTKHNEVDCHFMRDNLFKRINQNSICFSLEKLVNIITKGLGSFFI